MNFMPLYESASSNDPSSNHFKTLYTDSSLIADSLLAVLNSNLFFLWFVNYSACRDLTLRDLATFPIKLTTSSTEVMKRLQVLTEELMISLNKNSVIREYNYASGKLRYQEFYMRKSKPIIDEIDRVLAKHYGFTDEELDFIINYDIKYRMGRDGGENGDEDGE